MLAQTWSEHCAHKTFRAIIDVTDGIDGDRTIDPLLVQLRDCTDSIDAPFVRSAFVGNAGVIEFTEGTTIALKAETHNHPSAVEPFGGANTGVGGVIRDVLGIAHRPIAVTDILCFGPADLPAGRSPRRRAPPPSDPRRRDRRCRRLRQQDRTADRCRRRSSTTRRTPPTRSCSPAASAPLPTRPLHTGPFPGDRVVVLGGAPVATASAARRSRRRPWTPRPARSPARACRSVIRSSRSC